MKKTLALLTILSTLNGCDCSNTLSADAQPDRYVDSIDAAVTKPSDAAPEFIMEFSEEETAIPLNSFSKLMGLVPTDCKAQQPPARGKFCGLKVALVGDSLTAGNNYNQYLVKMCSKISQIANEDGNSSTSFRTKGTDLFAAWGRHTVEMRNYLPIVIEAWDPDTVVIIGGTNDLSRQRKGVGYITKNLYDMFSYANSKGVKTISATILPVYTDTERRGRWHNPEHRENILYNIHALNTWILSDSNPANIKIDMYQAFEHPKGSDNANPSLTRDGLHPNRLGQQLFAWKIYEALTR